MSKPVDILMLGSGWTSTFLIPLCDSRQISYAATTRSGSNETIPFTFDPESDDVKPYKVLPDAQTVVIVFPITVKGGSKKLVKMYQDTRKNKEAKAGFIQLGATTIWGPIRRGEAPSKPVAFQWYDRHSPMNVDERGEEETELLSLSPQTSTTVLDLAALWGGGRSMKGYIDRVLPTKEVTKNKGSIHVIHGDDVARAIVAVHLDFSKSVGQRWILSDMRIYDWWDLASAWSAENDGPQAGWVRELMKEEGIRGLPRQPEQLGRALDARDFWEVYEISPLRRLV
ncbi:hypothetical protein PM082_022312 [Marasmius tenuissimus]|nr:hypothetical protein PM082_022312 [Marasmius tenuissimus]